MDFETLYGRARGLPIIDWHNHLDMRMLAEDKPLGSLYEVWVKADPYKHRAMRICGEPERLITGTGTTGVSPVGNGLPGTTGVSPVEQVPESEKWAAWMRTLPQLVGNPIFAWAKMELEWLGLDANAYLRGEGENITLSDWTPSKMLSRFKVEYLSPCMTASSLGQRASRPLETAPLGQRASRPLKIPVKYATGETPVVPVCNGQDARCPSQVPHPLDWTAAEVKEFPGAQATPSAHFSGSLQAGDFHCRNLPHVGQSSTLVFVTFRLADSLPQSALDDMASFREEWLKEHPEPWDEATRSEWHSASFARIEKRLDAGHGSCLLADSRLRKVVEGALEFFNGQDARCPNARYRLHAYVVMPNHVHVLMELFDGEDLAKVVQSWKSFTAKELNRLTGSNGRVWMAEYYDRLIRNAEHYENTIRYIRENGVTAKWLAERNGQDARCPSATGETPVVPVRVVPSLRMNAGDEVAEEVLERFHAAGCRVVDISVDDAAQLETCYDSLASVAAFAAAHGWTMLLHLGALRETSARLRAAAGPVGGFAGMRAPVDPAAVAAFLDRLECNGQDARCPSATGETPVVPACNGQDARCPSGLPRTVLLTLNPEAHAQLAVLAGSFVEEGVPGKVQLGPAWWWCDHAEAIRDVFEKQAAYGVLSTFVGMTTDSRSLLSFVRHDYFRRLFCRWLADKVATGEFPDDPSLLLPIVENVCYRNAHSMVCDGIAE